MAFATTDAACSLLLFRPPLARPLFLLSQFRFAATPRAVHPGHTGQPCHRTAGPQQPQQGRNCGAVGAYCLRVLQGAPGCCSMLWRVPECCRVLQSALEVLWSAVRCLMVPQGDYPSLCNVLAWLGLPQSPMAWQAQCNACRKFGSSHRAFSRSGPPGKP